MKQRDIYRQLNQLAKYADPWKKTPSYEKKATQNMLSLIQQVPHDSILEVGCGYGAFTKCLSTIAKQVTAIDVSVYAIQEARKKAPKATCLVADLETFTSTTKFDVIVCSEVLYYIKDVNHALTALERLGNYLVTSHFFVYVPSISFGSIKYEWYLRKYKMLQTVWEASVAERYLVKKTVFCLAK